MRRSRHSKTVWGPLCLFLGIGVQLCALVIPKVAGAGNEPVENLEWFVNLVAFAGFALVAVGLFGAILTKRHSATVAMLAVFGVWAVMLIPVVVLDYPFRLAALAASLVAHLFFWILPVPGAREGW